MPHVSTSRRRLGQQQIHQPNLARQQDGTLCQLAPPLRQRRYAQTRREVGDFASSPEERGGDGEVEPDGRDEEARQVVS